MKNKRLHIVILILWTVLSSSVSLASIQQKPQQNRTFNPNFKEQYSGKKYDYEGKKVVSNTPTGSGKYEKYKNGDPTIKESNNHEGFSINLGSFSWIFYIAIFIAVLYLVYILLNEGGSGLFSSKGHKNIEGSTEITSENIENADINALINRAEDNEDYRLAIRYYYLLVLKTLTLKNHIKFEDDKTNAEYLNETHDKSYGKDFAYTSYLYNYIWYGEFPLDTAQYRKAKHNFTTLINQVK
ncbi:hypothetical protein [Confluentibacter sediminis]|uniref:hypothetical protein n=1 Tax=Confluentibacter sediminis TaxID=2219045 RepID=UPI0013A6D272|nr:hypothetical protein [Confluentibacter sediminis]